MPIPELNYLFATVYLLTGFRFSDKMMFFKSLATILKLHSQFSQDRLQVKMQG